jgi:hypothetical protein
VANAKRQCLLLRVNPKASARGEHFARDAKLSGVKRILQALLFKSCPRLRLRSIFAVGRN